MSYEDGRLTRREAEELRRRKQQLMEQRRRASGSPNRNTENNVNQRRTVRPRPEEEYYNLEEERTQLELERRRLEEERRMYEQNRQGKKPKKKKKKTGCLIGLIILLLLIVLCLFIFLKLGKIQKTQLEGVQTCYDTGNYTNIALFGLDSREGELQGGVNSDTIIIASINNKTKDVKLASVYRDTYLQHDGWTYDKANAAYCNGGPTSAINMLNRNLDLDISDFVTINFKALINTVDLLGGLDIEMTSEEVYWMNGYVLETAEASGVLDEAIATQSDNAELYDGVHHLNGVQATAYCRIRYTDGGDYARTGRQRTIINAVLEKAKHTSIFKLNKIANTVLPQVYTSFSSGDIFKMMLMLKLYKLNDTIGFPFDKEDGWINEYGQDCVVPIGLAQNVRKLHGYLFEEWEYQPSELVQSISDDIAYITGIDPAYYDLSDTIE